MVEDNDLLLSFIRKRSLYGLNFNLARRGEDYYLIDCSQSFLGNFAS